MRTIAVLLLMVSIAVGSGAVALLLAFIGYNTGVAGWFLALLGGIWLLYVLLVPEYPTASGRGPNRKDNT